MANLATRSSIAPALPAPGTLRCLVLGSSVAVADWLFYERPLGVSLALFVGVLAVGAALMPRRRISRSQLALALGALVLGVGPSLQAVNPLSFTLAVAGLVVFTLLINQALAGDVLARLQGVARFALRVPVRLLVDAVRMLTHHRREARLWFWPSSASDWVVPVSFGFVFVGLFSEANPMIGRWFAEIDLSALLAPGSLLRLVFWAICAVFCWPFLRVRGRKLSSSKPAQGEQARREALTTPLDRLFSEQAVFRSLVLFNSLFGLQNGLDAAFLWGAAALPEGMTYASYAHRGAYTLIATALLAAGFVLFASRPGAPSEHSVRVRVLLLLWTAQNAVLVQYSVLRLNLYVDAYALTYWRLAAFAWMALVFAGLVLIFLKFAWGKSARWLINTNLLCLAVVLYGAGNTNFPEWIANHNTRLPEPGQVRVVDTEYLAALGPTALPAVDRVLDNPLRFKLKTAGFSSVQAHQRLKRARPRLSLRVARRAADWRGWGWRHARTRGYLTARAARLLGPWSPDQP